MHRRAGVYRHLGCFQLGWEELATSGRYSRGNLRWCSLFSAPLMRLMYPESGPMGDIMKALFGGGPLHDLTADLIRKQESH